MHMKKTVISNFIFSTILIICLVTINNYLQFKKPHNPESFTTFSAPITKIFSFGNYRFISSFIWTKTLLDADTSHTPRDRRSWLFYRFKLISSLDPTFYENYLQGGIYLSIIKDDIEGARILFDKGLTYFSNDTSLLYYSAFNYHFELNNYEKSLEQFKKLKEIDPYKVKNIDSLITDAKLRKSNINMKREALLKIYRETKDEELKEAIRRKLKIKKGP